MKVLYKLIHAHEKLRIIMIIMYRVFDEVHKTAGRQGRAFSSALDDGNVPIKKRVFFTATPRHCNPLRKDAEGEAEVLYSMDDKAQYGKVAYELSCRKAVELGIICDYKVLATVFTTAEGQRLAS
jgi:predicted helicase